MAQMFWMWVGIMAMLAVLIIAVSQNNAPTRVVRFVTKPRLTPQQEIQRAWCRNNRRMMFATIAAIIIAFYSVAFIAS